MAAEAQARGEAGIEAWLEEGLALHQAGERPAAEALFRRALAEAPDDPTALYLLGLARFEAGDAAGAAELMERVVALRPGHAQARLTLANLRLWLGEEPRAAEHFRRAVDLTPGRPEALTGLSQALLAGGDAEAARLAAEAAVGFGSNDAPARLALAASLAALGQAQASAEAYEAALTLAPEQASTHASLAFALLQADAPERALASAERAIALDEASADAWFALGAVRQATGRFDAAARALERAIALDPQRAAAHMSLGSVLIELENYEAAEAQLVRAIELDPLSAEAFANLSSLCCRAEAFDRARTYALAALELDPDLVVAHQNLAGVLAREGREDESRRHLDRAYGVTNLFVVNAANPVQRVLVLTTTESGNIPHRYLLPAARYTRMTWFIEYARAGQMKTLPTYDVVFNGIGDPDLTGPTRRNTERFLQVCERPLFNHPDRVGPTRRDQAPALFAGIADLVIPPVARIEAAALAEHGLLQAAAMGGVEGPLLVRPIGSHGGQGLILLTQDDESAAAAAVTAGLDHYVTAFRDFSRDGLWRKYRMIFVDRRPYPYHLAVGERWMVHYETSGTADHAERLAEERLYLEDPEAALGARAMAALRDIGRRMDLDFCGVDFSLLEDGRVLLFEANATMLVHPEAADGPLAHKNPFIERIYAAFRAMLAEGGSAV